MESLNSLWRDLVLAGRSLMRARAFTLVCVISLGIGMTPVIAVPYGARVLDIPPPLVNTTGMVELITAANGPHPTGDLWSYPDFKDLQAADTGLTLFGWALGNSDVQLRPDVHIKSYVSTMYVPGNYFRLIGVPLTMGPGFDQTADDPLTSSPAVVLGNGFWRSRLGADAEVIGKTLTINGAPHVVVGVAPETFEGHNGFQPRELFIPLEQAPALASEANSRLNRSNEWIHIHGRLPDGMTIAQADATIAGITARLAREYPSTNEFRAGAVKPYHPLGNRDRTQFALVETVAFTLTGMILLVVCLNISGMVQVRSALRERELSIRQAIGTSRRRLMRYLLSEAFLLALAGGTLASFVLFNVPSLIAWAAGRPLPVQVDEALTLDLPMVAICLAICFVTSLVFGLLPAARFSRPVILTSLKDDAGGGGLRVGRAHRFTAALQIAIAVPLIVMSFMSLDRFRATALADLGFASEQLYAAPLNLEDAENPMSRMRSASADLADAGSVASVTVADGLPLDFRGRTASIARVVDAGVAPTFRHVQATRVGDDYFETLGIPVVRGRGFSVDDRPGSEPVTVISKPLADLLFPDTDAIGQRLLFGTDPEKQKVLTVVGVTADFPTSQMSTAREQMLLPLAQYADIRRDSVSIQDDMDLTPRVMLIARSESGADARDVSAALERVVHQFDPESDPASIITGVGLRQKSMRDFLTQSTVAGIAGGVILMLSALGIYGVVGLMVATRTREIAVRAALGASRGRVMALVLLDVVKLATPGILVGIVLAVAFNRLNAENMGIPLSDLEPISYVIGAAVALLVAIVGSLAPARRAASVDPMVAMRSL